MIHESMKCSARFLVPLAVLSLLACDAAKGKDAPPNESLENASSLADRALISIVFMHPVGMTISTRYRQPLLDHLTANAPFLFRALFSTESERTVGMLHQRLGTMAHLGVVSYLEAHEQFGALPVARPLNPEGKPVSHCVFLVRQDSPLRSLTDLKGRSLALGAYHATLSNLIARHELIQAGIQPEDLAALEHFDNDEAVAFEVSEGRFDAGAVGDLVARRYQDKGLRALHVSDPIPSAPIVARPDLPRRVSESIREALLMLDFESSKERQHWDEDIRYGFASATDADYEPVRNIMKNSPTGCTGTCHAIP